MYIKKIVLKSIRCFKKLVMEFDLSGNIPPYTVIVGDNATGKTTLLRNIALGLCDETSAAGLMRESDEGYIRRGEPKATIQIELVDKEQSNKNYTIQTKIEKVSRGEFGFERIRQTTKPHKDFPWERIFICAYGAGRGTSGTGDIAGWSGIDAVYNLFNYREGLQNPELIIHRIQNTPCKNKALKKLGDILLGDKNAIKLTKSGIEIEGVGLWGKNMPLRDLADGYRSSFLWITDFIGWALAFDLKNYDLEKISGIILIDEIEQHLHATWQRRIVHKLKEHLPNVQFIVTTHSPLIASAIGPISDKKIDAGAFGYEKDKLVYLELQDENIVTREYMDSMRLRRIDQVLASRAFKYMIDEDPGVERLLREASILAGNKNRSKSEERLYKQIYKALEPILLPRGQTLIERELESKRWDEITAKLKGLDEKIRKRR